MEHVSMKQQEPIDGAAEQANGCDSIPFRDLALV
jgi:hypothetical protein